MRIIKPSVEYFGAVPTEYNAALKFIEMAGRTCYRSEDKITEDSAEGFVRKLIKAGHLAMVEHSNFVVRHRDHDNDAMVKAMIAAGKFLTVRRDSDYLYVGGNLTAWYQREMGMDETLFEPFLRQYDVLFEVGDEFDTAFNAAVEPSFGWTICPHDEIPKELHRYSAKFICDRGVSHELVRHRPCSFAQESTRYVSSINTEVTAGTQEDVVSLYEAGMSMRQVSEKSLGLFTEWDVYKILVAHDVDRRPLGNTGPVAHDFFNVIDSVEKSYLLGVIQADGSIRATDSPQISITQHKEYAWYLHRMVTQFLRPSAMCSADKNCNQITVTSPQLKDDLCRVGIIPNKSYDQTEEDISKLWEAVPPGLLPSFIRGFLDGDGGVRFFKQKNKGATDSCNINWSGNLFLLQRIQQWLFDNFSYNASLSPDAVSKNMYRLRVTSPTVGRQLVTLLLEGFTYPYGHPEKTARMMEGIGLYDFPVNVFGDEKFIIAQPSWLFEEGPRALWTFLKAMDQSERSYEYMRRNGLSPQQARAVLPNALKTEIVVTADAAEWAHIRKLRTAKSAHPDMQRIMNMMPWEEFL